MARKKEEGCSYIAVNLTKRAAFMVLFLLAYVMIALILVTNLSTGGSWTRVILPILLVSLPVLLFSPIESWVYEPWQAKSRKYERHYLE